MQNSIEHYLEATDGAGKLMSHARYLVKLARIFREIAPPHLYQASTLANYKSGVVIIHAHSGAIASKLRQLAPTLTAGFARKGVECTDVQVKVQAPENPEQTLHPSQRPLTTNARGSLEHLRDTLPDDPLRQAIEQLLVRSATTE